MIKNDFGVDLGHLGLIVVGLEWHQAVFEGGEGVYMGFRWFCTGFSRFLEASAGGQDRLARPQLPHPEGWRGRGG